MSITVKQAEKMAEYYGDVAKKLTRASNQLRMIAAMARSYQLESEYLTKARREGHFIEEIRRREDRVSEVLHMWGVALDRRNAP